MAEGPEKNTLMEEAEIDDLWPSCPKLEARRKFYAVEDPC